MKQKIKILDVKLGSFKNDSGETISYTTLLVRWVDVLFNGVPVVSKMKASKDFDFVPYLDKIVDAELSVSVDNSMQPTLRCVGIVDKISKP